MNDYTEPNEQREESQDFIGHFRVVNEEAAWQIWQMKDSITTVVEANGYSIWDLSQQGYDFSLELTEHLEDDAVSILCGQFPITADYSGEGSHGTIITLYT